MRARRHFDRNLLISIRSNLFLRTSIKNWSIEGEIGLRLYELRYDTPRMHSMNRQWSCSLFWPRQSGYLLIEIKLRVVSCRVQTLSRAGRVLLGQSDSDCGPETDSAKINVEKSCAYRSTCL